MRPRSKEGKREVATQKEDRVKNKQGAQFKRSEVVLTESSRMIIVWIVIQ
jgi:hypothetical protein